MNLIRLPIFRYYKSTLLNLKSSFSSVPKSPNESFIVNAFAGNLNFNHIFPYPRALNEEECQITQSMIDPIGKFFAEDISSDENDRIGELNEETRRKLADLGCYGLITPTEYGGLGLNTTQTSRLSEEVGHFDLAIMIHIGAHQSIGYRGIINYGTSEQKKKYLPDLASGKKIAAYCLTEPSAGSNAAAIKSKAVLSPDGKHYILNGSKIWITNGGMADVMTVFAQTPVVDEKGEEKLKITAFIVERAFGGVTSGKPVSKMGIKASETCEVFFDDVHIPVENVLGEVGKGFYIAVNILNMGRSSICASMCGTMKEMLKRSIKFASEREQFGSKIVEYGVIKEKLAKMAMKIYASESIGYLLAGNYDRKVPDLQVDAAICKIYGSDAAWSVVDDAIQIHGGMGYMRETELERVARDVRICRIFEGTNEILRLFVALNGFQYAGNVMSEFSKNPIKNVSGITSMFKTKLMGASADSHLKKIVHGDLIESANKLGVAINHFSKTVTNLLMKHKKSIKDRQYELFRIGEASISIHVMAAVLSRASGALTLKNDTCQHEADLCKAICAEEYLNVSKCIESINEVESSTSLINSISDSVVKNGDYLAKNPIGL